MPRIELILQQLLRLRLVGTEDRLSRRVVVVARRNLRDVLQRDRVVEAERDAVLEPAVDRDWIAWDERQPF